MTRLEGGSVPLRLDWESIEELVGAAVARRDVQLAARPVAVNVPPDLPLLRLDGRLITEVMVRLLDNALAYTPPTTPIRVQAMLAPDRRLLPAADHGHAGGEHSQVVLIEVADAGPGLPPGDETRVFEKFFRGPDTRQRGVGLGLAICRGIISAHGGAIWAEAERGGGTRVRFWLPIDRAAPEFRVDARGGLEPRPLRQAS
jgi:two-component system sensor histidine kinase KdpD